MAASPELKNKKQTEYDQVRELVNNILAEAMKTRDGFTPAGVQNFYNEGVAARQQRLAQNVTPARRMDTVVIRKSGQEPPRQKPEITVRVSQNAIEASVGLAEVFELAAAGRKLDLKKWVVG